MIDLKKYEVRPLTQEEMQPLVESYNAIIKEYLSKGDMLDEISLMKDMATDFVISELKLTPYTITHDPQKGSLMLLVYKNHPQPQAQ